MDYEERFSPQILNSFQPITTLPNGVFAMTLKTSNKTCFSVSFTEGGYKVNVTRNAYIGCSLYVDVSSEFKRDHVRGTYHSCQLSIRVVGRCHFNNICRDDLEAIEPPQNGTKLPCRPAARFWCSSRWGESRIDGINLPQNQRDVRQTNSQQFRLTSMDK